MPFFNWTVLQDEYYYKQTLVEIMAESWATKTIVDLLSFTPAEFDPANYYYVSPFWSLLKRGLYDVFKVAMNLEKEFMAMTLIASTLKMTHL
jgi:hypothetical protein